MSESPSSTPPVLAAMIVAVSVLLSALAIEVAYRLYLGLQPDPISSMSFQATNQATSVYSESSGYNYRPDSTFTMATVKGGRLVACHRIVTDSLGNIGLDEDDRTGASWKVLVVGDSFSDNMHLAGYTWPDAMDPLLEEGLGVDVSILNYSRSGYGLAQMFAAARHQASHLDPDFIVIPFILPDLTRPRLWRSTVEMDGVVQQFRHTTALYEPGMRNAEPFSLVHGGIDESWCERTLREPEGANPVLEDLLAQHARFARASHEDSSLWSLRRSFFYQRFVLHDYSGRRTRLHPRESYALDSFADDAEFMADLRFLKQTGIPFRLVRLPQFGAMEQNAHASGTAQQRSLLDSLEQLTGQTVLTILPQEKAVPEPESLFLLPYDAHPSRKGGDFYANAVASRLMDELEDRTAEIERPGPASSSHADALLAPTPW